MTRTGHQMCKFSCAMVVLLSHAACSAQTPATSSPPPLDDDRYSKVAVEATAGSSLRPGEYITEKGWGHLQLSEQEGVLTFSIESVTGEDYCGLDGKIQDDQGIAKGDNGPSACSVKFTSTPQGIDVSASTPAECKAFCGYNGGFEGPYLRAKDGCGRGDLERTRKAFKRLYDTKDYKAALATLSPALANCLPTLEWEEEGGIRNDLAITQYKSGFYGECLKTLEKYADDAKKDDDAVVEGWTPALADRYLAIVIAARTNIGLCSRNAKNDANKLFDGEWAYAKRCGLGHFVSIMLKQTGNKASGTWSYGTNLRGSDGLLEGRIRDGKLFVRHCTQEEESGYKTCPEYGDEMDYFVRRGEDLIRYQKYGNNYKEDVVLHRDTPGKQLPIDNTDCQEDLILERKIRHD